MKITHKQKVKIAYNLTIHSYINRKDGVAKRVVTMWRSNLFNNPAWEERKQIIAEKVALREVVAKQKSAERKANHDQNNTQKTS